jgi:hypothetical protein
MKSGIFVNPVCVDYTGNTCNATSKQITNINPIAAAYIKDVWSKIPAGDPGTFNLFTPQRVLSNSRQELIKIDHTFTAKYAVSVRFVKDSIPTQEPGGLFTGAVILRYGHDQYQLARPKPHGSLHVELFIFAAQRSRVVVFVWRCIERPVGTHGFEEFSRHQSILPFPVTLARVPSLSIGGLSSLTGYGPYRDYNRNHNIFDNLVKLMGNHTLKAGISINFYQKTENAASANAGTFTFPSTPRPTGASTVEQGWANFLLGNVSTFTQASLDLTPDMRVSSRLTSRTTNSSLRLSYTWSKVMTDAGSDRSNAPQNFYDRAADYARAPFDRTQVLTD